MAQPKKKKPKRRIRPGKVVPKILLPGVWYRMYFASSLKKIYRVMVTLEERKEIPDSTFVLELKVPVDAEFYKCRIDDAVGEASLSICSDGTYSLLPGGPAEETVPTFNTGHTIVTATNPIDIVSPKNWVHYNAKGVPFLNLFCTRLDVTKLAARWKPNVPFKASTPGAILSITRRKILYVSGFPGMYELPEASAANQNPLCKRKITVSWKEDLPYRFRKP